MSSKKTLPALQSAYLNVHHAEKSCSWARTYWLDDEPDWEKCVEAIQFALDDLESAKAKIKKAKGLS